MRCFHASDGSNVSCSRRPPACCGRFGGLACWRRGLMDKAVFLAVAAALCTATASVCQRAGARNTGPAAGVDARLIVRLARQPAWLLGRAAVIGGVVFPLHAPRVCVLGPLQ